MSKISDPDKWKLRHISNGHVRSVVPTINRIGVLVNIRREQDGRRFARYHSRVSIIAESEDVEVNLS